MLKICQNYGHEFDVSYNANKTVCIFFNGKRYYREHPPDVFLNDIKLNWVLNVKHLGNIITWNLSEELEIEHKVGDFIGRTNSLIANFKGIHRNIISHIFCTQCCHLYGCQAWALDSKYLDRFDVPWRKAIRKLWYLPYRARSKMLPILVNSQSVRDHASIRFIKMYNSMYSGKNYKMKVLCNISVYSNKK